MSPPTQPMTPEMMQYWMNLHVERWTDNLNVTQKVYDSLLRSAQQGTPLDTQWEFFSKQTLGQHLAEARGQLEAIKVYLAEARAAAAQGAGGITNFMRTTYQSGVQILQMGGQFIAQHEVEIQQGGTGAIAATGGAIQYGIGGGAATAGAAGEGAAAAGAIGETTAAAGAIAETTAAAGAVGEATAAAGAIGEATVAAGAIGEATVAAGGAAIAETTVAAGGVAIAEAGVGSTVAAGAAGGSWLGPVGIVVGIAVAGIIAGGIYVYNHDDKPAAAISTISSDSDTESSTSDSDSSRETTTTEVETTTTTSPPARSLDGSYQITSTVVSGGTEDLTCNGREATLEVHATATTFDFGAVATAPRGPGETFTFTVPATAPDGSPATETIKGDFDPSADPPTLTGTSTILFEGGVRCDFRFAGARVG
jgi:hypothetical protein